MRKLRYSSKHQRVCNLVKGKIIFSILNSTLQKCFGLKRVFFSKTTKKKMKEAKAIFPPPSSFKNSNEALFLLKTLPRSFKQAR